MPLPTGLDVTFERTECLGACAAFTVTIHHDGRVDWQGRSNVRVVGGAHKLLGRNELGQIAFALDGAHFFEREHDGRMPPPPCNKGSGTICLRGFTVCSDAPHFIITVTRDGKKHEVDDAGCYRDELEDLRRLEKILQNIAGIDVWIGT